jgi:hypothetical protein
VADSFTSPLKEGVQWIFITLKKSITFSQVWTREPWVQRKAH